MARPPAATLAELMTARPICLAPDERLDIASALMVSCGFRHLPVEKSGRLVGIVSLRDLYAVALPRETTAESVMSHPVVTAAPGTALWWAAHTMLRRRISCLLVVVDEHLVGIVTTTDFVRHTVDALRTQGDPTVAQLMTPRPLAEARPEDTLDLAQSIMKGERIRHLPVLSGERLVGLLSDHDVIRATGRLPGDTGIDLAQRRHEIAVRDAMSDRVITISPEASAAQAGALLLRRKLGALPVVRGNRLVGMLSVADYFHYLLSLAPPADRGAPRCP